MFNNKTIFITGGTGSFGNNFLDVILKKYKLKKVIIYSRDEYKQFLMQKKYSSKNYPFLRFFLGDIRDRDRLTFAMRDVDYVIHAAALKQVPAGEYNPMEFIKTNVHGAENVIYAAIAQKVKKVIALSTDKACNPINLYGTTKLASDKIFVSANNIVGSQSTSFSVVRYGNVAGSRGSVIPFFDKLIKEKKNFLPITHEDMTRFWITLDQSVEFVIRCFYMMTGGETYVPKIPSVKILDLAKAMAPKLKTKIVGIRPGEKIHELLCPKESSHLTADFKSHYVILPTPQTFEPKTDFLLDKLKQKGKLVAKDFEYSSGNNKEFLSINKIKSLNKKILNDTI